MYKFLSIFIITCSYTVFSQPAQTAKVTKPATTPVETKKNTPQKLTTKLELGKLPPEINLSGDLGGRVNETPWSSKELKNKIHVLFYVAPSEKDTNNETSEALKALSFPRDQFHSVAVINMAASMIPNFMINSSLKSKQREYKHTTYVKDYDKEFIKKWKIKDEASNVLAFNKKGELIFRHEGKLDKTKINQLVKAIQNNLKKNTTSKV